MTNDVMLGSLYLLMAAMLVLGSLMSRREPFARLLKMALAWIVIFGAGFVLFSFRDNLAYVGARLKAEATGAPIVTSAGHEVRVPMSIDGHFWVNGLVNGHPVKFLIDSGATMTTIDRSVANEAGVAVSRQRDQLVKTGNGVIRVATGQADTLRIASIERADVGLHVADGDDMNVLGMNFLSSLDSWTVEGRWLVMRS
ncbi:TIGR02281 family clan AA aspartic protease [Sphingomonas sp. ASV193]|uniref:retropepsin-like aspartic protease family protein n=1 Tax=Sphingomonas sp. ASV193 TaxID=3144405 RepID=UPI0032E85228